MPDTLAPADLAKALAGRSLWFAFQVFDEALLTELETVLRSCLQYNTGIFRFCWWRRLA